MDPNYLLKDELEFELACRGVVLRSTVPVLKKLLVELMNLEQTHGPVKELVAPGAKTVAYELEICSAKLNVLSNYISELTGKPDRALFRRLVSRLYHVQNRLDLLKHELEDDGIRREALLQQCHVLLDKLEVQDEQEDDGNLTADDKEVLQKTLGELGHRIVRELENRSDTAVDTGATASACNIGKEPEVIGKEDRNVSFMPDHLRVEDRIRARLARSSTFEEDVPRRKLVPIYQWDLKFTGGNNMSVNAFLERVSELSEARNATDLDLWRYAIDLFEGDALIWYRANRGYASSWEELVILLKRAFQRPYYQEELLAEIRGRTQECDEPVLIYISVMQNMFNRLPNKLVEQEKVLIIKKNLLPYYQQAVCRDHFASILEMENVLRIIERTKLNCETFKQPQVSRSFLEPDLAYKKAPELTVKEVAEVAEMTSAMTLRPAGQATRRCWNCREAGHMFRECAMPKQRLFCFRCGRFGKTSKDCECGGNEQGGNSKPAS